MRLTSDSPDIPYHLRAARLRWAAFAVTLETDEIEWVQAILAGTSGSAHTRFLAQLLLSLHEREEISKLCAELKFSRRKLLELADQLTTKEGRRQLLSQPRPAKSRVRKAMAMPIPGTVG